MRVALDFFWAETIRSGLMPDQYGCHQFPYDNSFRVIGRRVGAGDEYSCSAARQPRHMAAEVRPYTWICMHRCINAEMYICIDL